MNEVTKGGSNFVGYEYKELSTRSEKASMYLDAYRCFGWLPDENIGAAKSGGRIEIKLKRDRKALNKAELTRLQRHFEACMDEIEMLEKSKTSKATMAAIAIGLLGTVFMAMSVFAVTNEPPLIVPCVLFAIPGFAGWILPSFVFKRTVVRRSREITPLIEQKYDEIYEICEKGNRLLSD